MKKGVYGIFCLLLVIIILLSFISASIFGDSWKRITGQAIAGTCGEYSYISPEDAQANSEYSSMYSADKTIDGKTDTYWFGKRDGFPKWLKLDLGEERCVNKIKLNIFYADIPLTFDIEVSDDGETWETIKEGLVVNSNDYSEFVFDEVATRYVRIYETAAKREYGTVTEVLVNSAELSGTYIESNCTEYVVPVCEQGYYLTPGTIDQYGCEGPKKCVYNGTCNKNECESNLDYYLDRFKICMNTTDFCNRSYATCPEYCAGWMGCMGTLEIDNQNIIKVTGNCDNPDIDLNCIDSNCGVFSAYSNFTCIDTDDGLDYFNYGGAKDYLDSKFHYDYCTLNGLQVESCTNVNDNCGIVEKYCSSNNRRSGDYLAMDDFDETCPNGCKDGACVELECGSSENEDFCINCYNNGGRVKPGESGCWCDSSQIYINAWYGNCEKESNYTCTDSDGGKNYYTSGKGTGLYSNSMQVGVIWGEDPNRCSARWDSQLGTSIHYDCCSDVEKNNQLNEAYCDEKGILQSTGYDCPNGCFDGACIESFENKTCSGLKDFIKEPYSFKLDNTEWILNWNGSWEYNNEKNYHASFSQSSNYNNAYINLEINELGNIQEVKLRLDQAIENGLCQKEKIYNYNNYVDYDDYKVVYLCKNVWDIAYKNQRNIDQYNNNYNQIMAIWISGNSVYRVYSSSYDYSNCYDYEDCKRMEEERHRQQQERIANSLEKLFSNEMDYVGGFYLSWEPMQFVNLFLNSCGSEIEDTGYVGSWRCKLEPVICPPHGEQKEICVRWNQDIQEEETREAQIMCSPGICAGCYIPKWLEGSSRDNKCIPYGFRFEQDTGEFRLIKKTQTRAGDYRENSDRVTLKEIQGDDEIDIEIYPNNTMSFKVESWSQDTFYLSFGDELNLLEILNMTYYDEYSKPLQFIFRIDYIYYDSNNYLNSYFDFTTIMETSERTYTINVQEPIILDMYCDIDGNIHRQKTVNQNGDWANCQNNYECESNVCSSGECVEVANMIRQAGTFKSLFGRVFCKLAHLLNEDNYNSCLANYF